MIARVATEISLNKFFDYEVPPEMEASISVGSRVKIPFNNREILGYVIELIEQSPETAAKSPELLPLTDRKSVV